MHFAKLRLSGFKSFVDPVVLDIAPGLTGIVGPNGCGKSNLLEGLRWVMAEGSSRRLRGEDMDDVIFSGTRARPGRNVAEAVLTLDNAERGAPGPYNAFDELQVSRRIERGNGSVFRVNGKEARARDVQLLFADLASGTRSSALVGQGQVAELIRSKPALRRHLLEEAAGIAGLQSRRREAELRLRAAEDNLERLADVVSTLEGQLAGLRRQARQARRYRRLGERMREAECRWLLRRWRDADEALAGAEAAMREIEARSAEATRLVARATTERAEAAEAVAPLRRAEEEAGARLNELHVLRAAREAEERRLAEQRRELEDRLGLLARDLERESTLAEDARRASADLAAEDGDLERQGHAQGSRMAEADAACGKAGERVAALDAAFARLAEQRAEAGARRRALEARILDLETGAAALERRRGEVADERARLDAALADREALAGALRDEEEARAALDTARRALALAVTELGAEREAEEAARRAFRDADAEAARLCAERDALAALVGTGRATPADETARAEGKPVLDELEVEAGFEAALGAALGDALEAPRGGDGPMGWALLPPYDRTPPLPPGAEPLADRVEAPPELDRRLAQTGLVEDADAPALAARLAPGQRLVSRGGGLWRWDGFVLRDAGTPAAARLAQRGRLERLAGEAGEATARSGEARAAMERRTAAAAEARARENRSRAERDGAAERAAAADEARRVAEGERRAGAARLRDLTATAERVTTESAAAHRALSAARDELARMPAPDRQDSLAELRRELDGERARLTALQGERDRIKREAEFRARRRRQILDERGSWRQRAERAAQRMGELAERRRRAGEERAELERQPALMAEQRRGLADRLEAAESARRLASDRRQSAENLARDKDRTLRRAESELASAREERARRQGGVDHGRLARDAVADRIRERLETTPSELDAALADAGALPDTAALEARLAQLARERDGMGPVNLRAEIEAGEVEEQLGLMLSERGDLEAAIARLRRGIGELNREGRARMLAAFDEIDGHFQALYRRMFGGHAKLLLVDSEDPLEAGLEVEASPSGKNMQVLSLLSGGEQALTALALVFALFLTNPPPVCVLDEVDAPLDDANVERFCALLDEFAAAGATRFLIITHHRLTMARMDRLFGVTMSEPGVSRLVSVDLGGAETMRAAQGGESRTSLPGAAGGA